MFYFNIFLIISSFLTCHAYNLVDIAGLNKCISYVVHIKGILNDNRTHLTTLLTKNTPLLYMHIPASLVIKTYAVHNLYDEFEYTEFKLRLEKLKDIFVLLRVYKVNGHRQSCIIFVFIANVTVNVIARSLM